MKGFIAITSIESVALVGGKTAAGARIAEMLGYIVGKIVSIFSKSKKKKVAMLTSFDTGLALA